MEDYTELFCCFDCTQYTGTPDSEACPKAVDVPAALHRADALKGKGREAEAEELLKRLRGQARAAGDWRSELSLTSELLGMYRHTGEAEAALQDSGALLSALREHRLGSTVSGATMMLNTATTMCVFGLKEESIPIFEHVSRVYRDNLDPSDYRFAGLYNNMALSYQAVGDGANAEHCFRLALSVISTCPDPGNELAVTYCNMAEFYDSLDSEDPRIWECMEKAWQSLDDPTLPRDGYHAFTLSKCVSAFDRFGYFRYAKECRKRMEEIYAGDQ